MQDEQIRLLVRAIKRTMEEDYVSLHGMARRLRVSPSHLSMVLSGKRRPGLRFLWAVLARYPWLGETLLGGREPAEHKKRPSGSRPEGP
ncbi:MAG: helix-turn-helix domain-containing protein [Anaerolineae bacterium]|jgi:transcriptional regulator with XRE-family HTH domain|nr:helix-turn-helix transcriptional regulator [Chloroflexota bacterium]